MPSNKRYNKSFPKKKIPSELDSIPSEIVEDGLFQVFRNGRIFKIDKLGKIECTIHKVNRYKAVSRFVNGKQKNFYVHRLLASAFLPNPDNKPYVIFRDGNKENISIDNLMWATHQELTINAYKIGSIDPFANGIPCVYCDQLTIAKDKVCPKCKPRYKKEQNKKKEILKRKESVSHVNLFNLTVKQREVVELISRGKSITEIARAKGISHQAVQQMKVNAIKRDEKLKSYPKKALKMQHVNKVKVLRKYHNFNCDELAELLEISSVTYRNKENGKTEFTVSEAMKIAFLFDRKVEDLFNNSSKKEA